MADHRGDGHIEATWDVALTDVEIKALAMGIPPNLVQPDHLTYWRPPMPKIGRAE